MSRIDPNAAPTAVAQGFGSSWLAYREADVVVRVDATGAITTIPVGREPSAVTVGRDAVWVADALDGTVKSIDPATSSVITTVDVGGAPSAIAEGDGSIWVANGGDGTLTRIDERTNRPTAHVMVGGSPQALVVADGKVWVSVQPQPAAQPSGGTLVVSVPSFIYQFDPAVEDTFDGAPIEYAICSTLLNYPDAPGPAGLRLVPDAARAMPTVSDGGRTYTFVIRRGLRFSPPSNELVTAADLQVHDRAQPQPAQEHGPRRLGAGSLRSGRPGGGRLCLHGRPGAAHRRRHARAVTGSPSGSPAPSRPARADLRIPFCAVPTDMPFTPQSGAFPTSGPYYIAAATPRRSLTLLRNPNYHGDRPRRPRRIEVVIGPQHPVAEVEASKLDYTIDGVTPDQSARLARRYGAGSPAARRGDQQYFVNPRLEVDDIDLNASRPLFASERMRRAVNYAVDRRALAANGGTFYAHGTVAQMYLPPGVPGFRNEHIYPLTPDVAKARRLAGPGRHTAVLYCFLQPGTGGRRAAQIIARNLAAIGINVQVKCLTGDQFYARILSPHDPWDMAVDGGGGVRTVDPGDFLDGFATRRRQQRRPRDSHVDALLDAASRQSGLARAFAYARVDHTLVRDTAPEIAFANESEHDFFSARVGCQLYQRAVGIDLGALCIRRS